MSSNPVVESFFDPATCTVTYLVYLADEPDAVIIDSVADYRHASGTLSYDSAQGLLDHLSELGKTLTLVLETHAHADHLSAGNWLREQTGAQLAVGDGIVHSQKAFAHKFGFPADYPGDGSEFDLLVKDGEFLNAGALQIKAMHTPGHTPGCVTWLIGDAAFVGDTVFMPDFGTARTDFPGGDAGQLYDSVISIHALPDDTRLFVGHDYAPGGRNYAWETTVAESRLNNIHISPGVSREAFIELREGRDRTLDAPGLLLPSVQVNIRAGMLPAADSEGRIFLSIPVQQTEE